MQQARSYQGRKISRRHVVLGGGAAGALIAACSDPDGSEPAPPAANQSTPATQGAAAEAKPTQGGRIVRSAPGDPPNFDPHATISYLTVGFLDGLHVKLVRYDTRATPPYALGQETLIGELADRWESPDSNLTWIFHLKRGVKFHTKPPVNGREVTANDVKWSWDRALSPGRVVDAWAWNFYDKVEVVDPHTIKFTLKFPNARLPNDLENYQSLVLPREADEQIGFKTMEGSSIGAGPWILDSYQPGSKWVAKRNPDYNAIAGGWPAADEYHSLIMNAAAARTAAFRARQLDILIPTVQEVASIKSSNPEARWRDESWSGADTSMLAFNNQEKPFDDIRVRQALSLAVDRDAWVRVPTIGKGKPESGPISWVSGDWKVAPDQLGEAGQWLKYDPQKAKQLLAAAGYPDGFETTINITTFYGPSYPTEAELIQEYLGKVGIKATINTVEYTRWISETYLGRYSGMVYGPDSLDRVTAEVVRRYSSWSDTNRSHVSDPALDQRLQNWRGIADPQKSKQEVWDLQKVWAEQAYAVFRPQPNVAHAWQPYVKNYEGQGDFAYESFHRSAFLWTDPVQS